MRKSHKKLTPVNMYDVCVVLLINKWSMFKCAPHVKLDQYLNFNLTSAVMPSALLYDQRNAYIYMYDACYLLKCQESDQD